MKIETLKKYLNFLIEQVDRSREDLKLTPNEIQEISNEVEKFQERLKEDTELPEDVRKMAQTLHFQPENNVNTLNILDRVLNLISPGRSNFDETDRALGLEHLENDLKGLITFIEMKEAN